MGFPKTRCLVNPEIFHPVRASMTTEKSENGHRNKIRDSPKNKREKRATLKKNILDTAGSECKTWGLISEFIYSIRVNVRLCSCVYFFDGLLFSPFCLACLFSNFSFINALILLVSFSFFRLFFVCSTHGIHAE